MAMDTGRINRLKRLAERYDRHPAGDSEGRGGQFAPKEGRKYSERLSEVQARLSELRKKIPEDLKESLSANYVSTIEIERSLLKQNPSALRQNREQFVSEANQLRSTVDEAIGLQLSLDGVENIRPGEAIAIGDSLGVNAAKRLSDIRNGHASRKEFLQDPTPKDSVIFSGQRVEMTVQNDSVSFSVDSDYRLQAGQKRTVPSEELALMAAVFYEYLDSPAGKRFLFCDPTSDDTPERYAMRVKHYRRSGFLPFSELTPAPGSPAIDLPKDLTQLMVLDNREDLSEWFFVEKVKEGRVEVRGSEYRIRAR